MKKFYFLSLVLFSAVTFGQSVVITRVIDGTLPHDGCDGSEGTFSPKIIEMYVSGTIDFGADDYRLQAESNGAANEGDIYWGGIGLYLSDLGEVTDSFVYTVNIPTDNGTPAQPLYDNTLPIFTDMYEEIPANKVIFSRYAPNMNGNDAIRVAIYDGDNLVEVIDQFGNPLDVVDGDDYTATWAYQDSYATRNYAVAPNGGNFDNTTFTYAGNNALDGVTCTQFVDAIGLGVLSTKNFDAISGLTMYPNPLSGNILNITSDANAAKTVAIYDVLGKQVVNTVTTNGTVNVSGLTSGVYIVKITEEGKTATRKLVVR
ncbi:T9SS type A sorting domain-containing protein [Flavobacterium salilacus subsp. salilacus]|uniref:T9SS type A sorting domain-containing protein n=1 Tax=Flavobacterium TaxID=237 RepID=UPI001389862B|nr:MULTISPECIES: T9SS type A sorting domain-containing protein [Flavobacterium]KAF2520100.1 T9SS type A sorting domain-containing protein [Flavobacterium salilacus subsp. salilacus]MBE1613984.1 T9SS type A sorting domain-containing protein [Flavobacterium sp. SaA2.13]NDI97909.1 T9SS type A sorting domain-containing protein [Flavobacterium salilacus subsp. altitudinum]